MRKTIFGAAAAALIAAASFLPGSAQAMVPGSAAAIQTAADQAGLTQHVVYVCRYGYWGRRCFWRPNHYWGAYGFARPGFGWHRGWGWRHHWRHFY